jgi:hypothetical protein
MTPADRARLRELCKAAKPGKREQFAHKYASFDYGETPQVFRSITQADEDLIIACDPETILAILDLADERDRLREAAVKAREAISLCVQAARPLAIAADPWFKKAEYATAALDEALGEKQ